MKIARITLYIALVGLAASLALTTPARAQSAIGFTSDAWVVEDNASTATGSPSASYNLGFEFAVTSPITVTSLGYFNDPTYDPINEPWVFKPIEPPATGSYTYADDHPVGIYDLAGNLLSSATVTSSGSPSGNFLYTSLSTPLNLGLGDYIIAGVTGPTDPFLSDIQGATPPDFIGLTEGPGISYVQDEYAGGVGGASLSNNSFSNDPISEPGFFGPNFQYQPQQAPVVPESSSLALYGGAGLALLVFLAVRRRRSSLNEA